MTEGEPVRFGALLRRLRLAGGLTQEELAERAQLSERAVRDIELCIAPLVAQSPGFVEGY
ncbi:MAG: helix-turn-helix transcriptional regulator [Chloroflexota bacterium]|nr:MAG: hypothetical protein DLM70_16330 [Chloroflexota bacterium]